MRILLIGANSLSFGNGERWAHPRRKCGYAPTTLTTLAALVPRELEAEIRIIDEAVEEVPGDYWNADIVGISAMTPDAGRAYSLADGARLRGATVVLGGYHPSFMPEEAGQHADAVVIGFAETSWPRLLRDHALGRLRKQYREPWRDSFMNGFPAPRRDLLKRSSYLMPYTLEATRGCPHQCSFCVVSRMHDRAYCLRSQDSLERELAGMDTKKVVLLDPSPLEDLAFSQSLFTMFRSRGLRWFSAATIKSIRDRAWVRQASRSGCRGLLIGFESLCTDSLHGDGKHHNAVDRYADVCAMLHDEGIAILGCFVFGFDGDDASVFDRTVAFVDRNRIDLVLYSVYTPFPGTQAHDRLTREKRILTRNWERYDGRHVVFSPAHMSADQLQGGLYNAWETTYSIPSIIRRIAGARTQPIFDLVANLSFRKYRKTFCPGRKRG